jgi:uncharacterized membrane protein
MTAIAIFLCLSFPALALWAEGRYALVRKLGAVVLCYAFGIGVMAAGLKTKGLVLQNTYGIAALMAVPLVLLSADLRGWLRLAKPTLLAWLGALVAAVLGAFAALYLTGHFLPDEKGEALTGMAVGVYTGGTPNLNAIALASEAGENLILQANIADTLFFLPYFFFVMSIGPAVLRRFLPGFSSMRKNEIHLQTQRKARWLDYAKALGLALLCLAVSIGLSELMYQDLNMALVVSVVTLGGLLLSLIPAVQTLPGSYQAGEYLLLVFCVGIGMSIDMQGLTANLLPVLAFMFTAAGTGFVLHILWARLFNIDADTFIITSVAAICSPLFVPPVARALGNKEIIASGMTTGVLGFAVGNWLGLVIASIV